MNIPLSFQVPAQGLRRALAAAALAITASCGADSLPSLPQQASSTAPSAASLAPQATSAKTTMPKDLRASYVAAVQKGASEAYAATSLAPGRMQLVNTAQRFLTSLDTAGVRIASEQQPWALSMRASGLGCDGAVTALDDALPEAEGNRVRYRHPGMEGWYLNGPLGLEQGFILLQAPACAGTKVLTLELGGDLHPKLEDSDGDGRGEALTLLDGEGHTALQYRDLFVKDAQGKELSAWMTVEAGRLSLHVDDAGAAYPVEIDPLVLAEQAKLLTSNGALDDCFGGSVALSGNTALVGAPCDNDNGVYSGSAYVFVKIAGVWTQQAKLLPTDGSADDYFGVSVALSGDTALVGAWGDKDHGVYSGSAYVFGRSAGAWTQQAKLLPIDGAAYDYFGYSVALSGDTALVGVLQDENNNGQRSGSACVFVRSAGAWTQQAKLLASDGAHSDEFGRSVALSGDTALVGAPRDNENDHGFNYGSAYVFVRSAGAWIQQAKLLPPAMVSGTEFGRSVALSGDTALVGASLHEDNLSFTGAAYVFGRSAGAWSQQAKLLPTDGELGDDFGSRVALSGDTALVGSLQDDDNGHDSGSAYVFVRSAGAWTQQAKLLPSDGASYDYFSGSIALSGDTALVGAHRKAYSTGAAYVVQVSRDNGDPCASGGQCTSTFCVDGVCCDTACGGGSATDCQACSVAAGAKMDGTCALRVQGTSCRPSAGGCDAPEVCDGVADSCPADAKVAAGTACRASTGACDAAELCDGLASDCPADAKVAAGTVCRAATGSCDVAESCDGNDAKCPADGSAPDGMMCTGGVCASGKCVEGSSNSSSTGSSSASSSSSGSSGSSGSGESGEAGGALTSSSSSSSSSSGGGEPQAGGCACRAAGGSSRGSSHGAGSVLGLLGLGLIVLRRRHRASA